MYKNLLKPTLDYFIVFIFSPLLIILFFVIFIYLILIFRSFNVFFFSKRVGKNSKPFLLYKFRTFYQNKHFDKLTKDEINNDILIPLGKFMRRYGLDEIPQCINILKNEMSLVGPRPKDFYIYHKFSKAIFEVKPGLIGLSAIIGRNRMNAFFKNKYDLYYVRNQSFLLDLYIFLNLFKLFKKKNQYDLRLYKK